MLASESDGDYGNRSAWNHICEPATQERAAKCGRIDYEVVRIVDPDLLVSVTKKLLISKRSPGFLTDKVI
jgi:hypothetical protein